MKSQSCSSVIALILSPLVMMRGLNACISFSLPQLRQIISSEGITLPQLRQRFTVSAIVSTAFPRSPTKRTRIAILLNRGIAASSTATAFRRINQVRGFCSTTRQIVSTPVVFVCLVLILKVVVARWCTFMHAIKSACSTGVTEALLAFLSCTHFSHFLLCRRHSCRSHPYEHRNAGRICIAYKAEID